MVEVTFQNHYQAGHTYTETWTTTDVCCPHCGQKKVWRDTSGGDYYVDEQHICVGCSFSFHLPYSGFIEHPTNPDHNDMQRLLALRAAHNTRPE